MRRVFHFGVWRLIPDDAIALASSFLKPRGIQDTNLSAAIVNEPFFLKVAGSQRNTGTGNAKHIGEEFVRQIEGVEVCAICAKEQPASKPLLDIMLRVTTG